LDIDDQNTTVSLTVNINFIDQINIVAYLEHEISFVTDGWTINQSPPTFWIPNGQTFGDDKLTSSIGEFLAIHEYYKGFMIPKRVVLQGWIVDINAFAVAKDGQTDVPSIVGGDRIVNLLDDEIANLQAIGGKVMGHMSLGKIVGHLLSW
jgi:hypothetical protein